MSLLLDLRTGDPILRNGDYVRVEDNYAFTQIIDCLLFCQVGTEVLAPEYGFDLESAIRFNSEGAPTQVIESLLAEALDPLKEKMIESIDSLNVVRDGQELDIELSVTSKIGTTTTLTETISNAV